MNNLICKIPSLRYTFHCPLSFEEKIPNQLKNKVNEKQYLSMIHSINCLLQSSINKTIITTGGLLCCKTTHIMYYGCSDAIQCVNNFINNNNKSLPNGHSMYLITTEHPPYLKYEIKTCSIMNNNEISNNQQVILINDDIKNNEMNEDTPLL